MSDIQRELTQTMTRLGIKEVTELPRYPVLTSIERPLKSPVQSLEEQPAELSAAAPEDPETGATTAVSETVKLELTERVAARIGYFSIDLSRPLGRCNILHEASMQTAFVNLREGQTGGEKIWETISEYEWICKEWNLRVSHSGDKLQIEVKDLGVCLLIDQPLGSGTLEP